MIRTAFAAVVVSAALGACTVVVERDAPDHGLISATAVDRSATEIAGGALTAEQATGQALARIAALDGQIGSVLAVNPQAMAAAREVDADPERGVLEGVPILIKDNIETREMPTTAGSLALANNAPGRDAPLVARLRDEGAVIIGKANLSEWANIRSSSSISGWSAVGGLTRNPHALDRSACGSSSGSAAAVAAGLVPAAIGTETDGSITCPAAMNGVVGLKPTVGLVSRTHVVPISHSQDTPGPMTRTVADAAAVLTAIAGPDPADPATAEAGEHRTDYRWALNAEALTGARIGVLRFSTGYHDGTDAVFEQALADLRAAGAILVDIADLPGREQIGGAEFAVLLTELKADLNAYLASTDPLQVPTRTLAEIIAFNTAEADREMPLFGQDIFIQAQAAEGLDATAYREARALSFRLAGPEGIDRLLREHDVVALVAPTTAPAWSIDVIDGDHFLGSASRLAAVSGYPHLTVPMGLTRGMPVGLSFIGPKWSEARLLALGYAYEQRTQRRRPPHLLRSVEDRSEIAGALAPVARNR